MNLYLAGDHGGFFLKEHLTNYLAQKNIAFQDLGTKGNEKVDYPDIAKLLVTRLLTKTTKGSGIIYFRCLLFPNLGKQYFFELSNLLNVLLKKNPRGLQLGIDSL